MPAFSTPGFTWGLSENEMCLWGGLDLNTYKPTNDLYYMKGVVKRGKNFLEIKLFSGPSCFKFDMLDHHKTQPQVLSQTGTPTARAGHNPVDVK